MVRGWTPDIVALQEVWFKPAPTDRRRVGSAQRSAKEAPADELGGLLEFGRPKFDLGSKYRIQEVFFPKLRSAKNKRL